MPNRPFLKTLSSGFGLQYSVSILLPLSLKILSDGKNPKNLNEPIMLLFRFNSLIFGIFY